MGATSPTSGCPYFLQEWRNLPRDVADASPIRINDTRPATTEALAELDANFFRVRFHRLAPAQKRYLRAIAELGPGPHRSSNIAHILNRNVTTVAPIRKSSIH